MRKFVCFYVLLIVAMFIAACERDPNHPGREFMPDMAHSIPYQTYSKNPFLADSMTARMPVAGTIPRGYQPYSYPNTREGYELAGKELIENPIPNTEENFAEGKRLYGIYCTPCHGNTGMGDGPVVTIGGFPPPPAFNSPQLKNLPIGKMFHSITYGKLNTMMPSYAAQLTQQQRWKVIHFVQTLQQVGEVQAGINQNKQVNN